jgi:hypothetical protein
MIAGLITGVGSEFAGYDGGHEEEIKQRREPNGFTIEPHGEKAVFHHGIRSRTFGTRSSSFRFRKWQAAFRR